MCIVFAPSCLTPLQYPVYSIDCLSPRLTSLSLHLDRTPDRATAVSQGSIECPSLQALAASLSIEQATYTCIAYICPLIFLDIYANARTCLYRLNMADHATMSGNVFDRTVRTNMFDTGGAMMPLPLNLIALIISYVGSHT